MHKVWLDATACVTWHGTAAALSAASSLQAWQYQKKDSIFTVPSSVPCLDMVIAGAWCQASNLLSSHLRKPCDKHVRTFQESLPMLKGAPHSPGRPALFCIEQACHKHVFSPACQMCDWATTLSDEPASAGSSWG